MATTSHLRQLNQWRVVGAMLRLKTASRSDLAKSTHMSQPTVGRIVEDLIKANFLCEVEVAPATERDGEARTPAAAVGRPSKLLSLNPHTPRFLGIQLGVRRTRLALLPAAPPEEDSWTVEFATPNSATTWIAELKKHAATLSTRGLEAVVISVPGVVNEETGQVLLSPNARWTEQQPIRKLLQPLFKKTVTVIQEIRALALGQYLAQPEVRDFLLVDLGNGVGAAVVINGELLHGALPMSGELGHTPVVGNDRPCSCGAIGCVETLVSRAGLVASSRENGGPTTWPALVATLRKQGMANWMKHSLDAVATTIAGAINVVGLRNVLITGSLEELPREVGDYLCQRVVSGAMWSRFGEVSCQPAIRRRQPGMVAAAIQQLLAAENP
jgi:N-acetylglucosamine repressor